MAEYQAPFQIDPDEILEQLEAREQIREQAWSMALERTYQDAETKFEGDGFKLRLERAIYLVENDKVSFDDTGRMWVQSESRPEIKYVVRKKPCLCEDAQKENAPNGFCKHRIAAWIFAQSNAYQDDIMSSDDNPNGNGHAPELDDALPTLEPELVDETPERDVRYVLNSAPCKATIKWRDEQGMEIWVIIEDFEDRALLERTKKYQAFAHQQIARANGKGIAQFGTPQKRGGGGRAPSGPKLRCDEHGVDYFRAKDGNYIHKKDDGKWCKAKPDTARAFDEKNGIIPKPPENFGDPPPMVGGS